MNGIKVLQYGCGKMSVYAMRYVYECGGEIVGAVDINPSLIGLDIGNIMGTDDKGIKVTDVKNIEELIKETKPDICIIMTQSLLSDCRDALITCAKMGVNAITTCEEAFYPINSNPNLTKEIDEIAKLNNCTITGSGYQDAFWGNLVTTLAGATHNIKKIEGSSSYNVEDYGIALAKVHGAGLSLDEFDEKIAAVDRISASKRNKLIEDGTYSPSYMWNVNGWLCDKLGLTVESQTQKCIPTTNPEDIESQTLNMTVKKGFATGMSAIVTTNTKEGIVIETECIGKVYSKTDCDTNKWTVYGEPDTTLVITRPNTVLLTCATIVNRIPDVIKAEPGFIPTSRMGELKAIIKQKS